MQRSTITHIQGSDESREAGEDPSDKHGTGCIWKLKNQSHWQGATACVEKWPVLCTGLLPSQQ